MSLQSHTNRRSLLADVGVVQFCIEFLLLYLGVFIFGVASTWVEHGTLSVFDGVIAVKLLLIIVACTGWSILVYWRLARAYSDSRIGGFLSNYAPLILTVVFFLGSVVVFYVTVTTAGGGGVEQSVYIPPCVSPCPPVV